MHEATTAPSSALDFVGVVDPEVVARVATMRVDCPVCGREMRARHDWFGLRLRCEVAGEGAHTCWTDISPALMPMIRASQRERRAREAGAA